MKNEPPRGAPEEELSRRKKRRNVGAFPCLKCSKVFSRSDHLARHYLNHQPKQVYVCDFSVTNHTGDTRTCGKTFVRKDLRERHFRRHLQDRAEAGFDSETPGEREESVPSALENSDSNEANRETALMPLALPDGSSNHVSTMALHTDLRPNTDVERSHNASVAGNLRHVGPNGAISRTENTMINSVPPPSRSPLNSNQTHLQAPGAYPEINRNMPGVTQSVVQYSTNMPHGPLVNQQQGLSSFQGPYSNMQLPPAMFNQQQQNALQGFPTHPNSAVQPYQQANYMLAPYPSNQAHNRPYNNAFTAASSTRQDAYVPQDGALAAGGSSFVQSQNDILSWLFMDSQQDMNTLSFSSTPTSTHPTISQPPQASPSGHPHLQHLYKVPQAEQPISFHNTPNPGLAWSANREVSDDFAANNMLNIGLQDLNYFLRSENPLDEVFLGTQNGQNGHYTGDKKIRNLTTFSMTSSSSPTNTNDSVTPRSTSEVFAAGVDRGTVKEHLQFHSMKRNFEKNKQFFLNKKLWARIICSLPEVTHQKLSEIFDGEDDVNALENRMSFYLYGYWETFHDRFSILHKPSFDTQTAEPLLLLSMLIVGCMYCATTPPMPKKIGPCAEYRFCKLVAEPLRFKLFQHPGFKCPVAVWVLQCLNLLEWCEKNYLGRDMHERGHIHHGTTVQLLRRSPFLGGNPTVKNKPNTLANESTSGSEEDNSDGVASDFEEQVDSDQSLFQEWVESESMKRITYMTFYLDTIDYIKFRHNPQIPFFQLQLLSLPCDEESLWSSNEINGSFKKLVKRQKKLQNSAFSGLRNFKDPSAIKPGMNFLSALKKLMKAQSVKPKFSTFTRSILFGGIASIMHQMQQSELQSSFTFLSPSSERSKNAPWKEILVRALDACEEDLHSSSSHPSKDPFFKTHEFQCTFPMYHLLLIIGISDINHYDIAIFCGSPRNMSVDVTSKDIGVVRRKLRTIWNSNGKINSFSDLVNVRSVIQCYWLLWSVMLPPIQGEGAAFESTTFLVWDTDHDYFDSMYAISIATLVLWCYIYSTSGLESSQFKGVEEKFPPEDHSCYEKLSPFMKEDGYTYLNRIRDEFAKDLKKEGLPIDYCIHHVSPNRRQVPLFDAIEKHCQILPRITLKENISGLCFLIGTKLYQSQWEIVRENAKLIINCGLRSVGKSSWQCPNLFDDR